MIDNFHIEIELHEIPNESIVNSFKSFEWLDFKFNPIYNRQGEFQHYQARLDNLLVRLRGHQLTIVNSIHKFYYSNNYSDFFLIDFRDAIESLSNVLNIDIRKAEVKNIEYGCNINWKKRKDIYENLIGYNRGFFYPMTKRGKRYGAKLIATDYEVKMYDKQYEVRTDDGLSIHPVLRFEKKVRYMRYLRRKGIRVKTVDDLTKQKIWKALSKDLLATYRSVIKKPIVDLNKLSLQQMKEVAVIEHESISKHIRKNDNSTYRRYIRNCEQISDTTQYNELQKKIKKKLKQLRKVSSDL